MDSKESKLKKMLSKMSEPRDNESEGTLDNERDSSGSEDASSYQKHSGGCPFIKLDLGLEIEPT